jgi:predicted PurR-regulated permease PerM
MFNLRDRIDIILRVTFGALILIGCYFVISPFLTPIVLAAILTVVSWPFYQWLTDKLKGHSTLSAGLMVSLMFVTVLIPLSIACTILARQIPEVFALVREWIQAGMPLPQWLISVPYIGHALEDTFQFGIDPAEIRAFLEKSLDPLTKWLWSLSWGVGNGLFQLILVAFIAFFFYRDGHTLSDRTVQFINRMSGGLAAEFTDILVKTTRSVVFGVIGTAIGQGLVAAVGFWIAGVPSIAVLSSLVCILSVVPVGPPLVYLFSMPFDMDPVMRKVFVLAASLPASAVIAVLAKQYGADEEYASETIGASTIALIFWLPVILVAVHFA